MPKRNATRGLNATSVSAIITSSFMEEKEALKPLGRGLGKSQHD